MKYSLSEVVRYFVGNNFLAKYLISDVIVPLMHYLFGRFLPHFGCKYVAGACILSSRVVEIQCP
jgi:hypothetical protein